MAKSGEREDSTEQEIWSTWEDLLLASAVHRHGSSHWDSVAQELHSRTPFSHLRSSAACRRRFLHLHRRFASAAGDGGGDGDSDDLETVDSGAWIEELRRMRVEELRREVERYDLSIVSLELKVNRLKEERDLSVKESSDPSGGDAKQEPTVEDRKDDDRSPGSAAAEISSRSCKESNSTDLKQEDNQHKSKQGDESGTGVDHTGTDNTAGEGGKRDGGDSGESVADSKESSDVQSSASLSTRRRKADSSCSEEETDPDPDPAKSVPFIDLMEMIRCDKSGSVFQRRLGSQESELYKSMIKRHVDLDTIQSKLDSSTDSYSSPLEFYRDLLLLCTNALLFFPNSSPEFSSASHVFSMVNNHLASTNLLKPRVSLSSSSSQKEANLADLLAPKPDPDPEPEPKLNPLLEKPTIIMCRKRSSLSKPNSSSQTGSSSKEEKHLNTGLVPDPDPNTKKTIISTRGPRTNKTRTNTTLHSLNPNPNSSISKPQKQPIVDKAASDKKRTAVDFLNRLNQSAPATSSSRVSMLETVSKKGGKSQSEGKRGNRKSLSPVGKRNVGRPPKRPGSSMTPPPAKRFKEEGSKGGSSGKRRTRR